MSENWRKQNAQDEHRMDRAFVVFLYVFGLAWLARAVVMLVNGAAIIGISQRYFQPIVHTPAFDALIGAVILFGAWTYHRRYLKRRARKAGDDAEDDTARIQANGDPDGV